MIHRLVLFDCDGTLVDSAGVIVAAMTAAFARHGIPAPGAAEVRAIIGLSLPLAVGRLATCHPGAPLDDIAAAYKDAYRDAVAADAANEPTFPGTMEALDALDDGHTLFGVVTGKSRRGLDRILAMHGMSARFAITRTADEADSKPSPDMVLQSLAATGVRAARTVVVGDTTFDMAMALAAGARPIGVAWGCHDAAELRQAGARAIAASMSDLPAVVAAVLADVA